MTQALCHCVIHVLLFKRAAFKLFGDVAEFYFHLPSFKSTSKMSVASTAEAHDLAGPNSAVVTSSADMQAGYLPAGW